MSCRGAEHQETGGQSSESEGGHGRCGAGNEMVAGTD
jgi:hypothetical protein